MFWERARCGSCAAPGAETVSPAAPEQRGGISVADTGPGIPAEHQPMKFSRILCGSIAQHHVMGFGAGYCESSDSEAHRGKIWVESETGLREQV